MMVNYVAASGVWRGFGLAQDCPEGCEPVASDPLGGPSLTWDGAAWLPDMDVFRAEANAKIDALAEQARQKYITPGAGQSMTYTEKAAEARDFKAGLQDPLGFPLLTAEIGITGDTIDEVASVILQRYLNFKQLGAGIERTRLGAKTAIAEAADVAAIEQILSAVEWP